MGGPDSDTRDLGETGALHIFGHPEIGQKRVVIAGPQQDIAGFDVAVNDALGMHMIQRGSHLAQHHRELGGCKYMYPLQYAVERLALDELHRKERGAIAVSSVQYFYDVGVRGI